MEAQSKSAKMAANKCLLGSAFLNGAELEDESAFVGAQTLRPEPGLEAGLEVVSSSLIHSIAVSCILHSALLRYAGRVKGRDR